VVRRYRLRVAGHEFCVFGIPPPQEGCLSRLLVFSPLGKRHFADNLWLDPLNFLRGLGRIRTGGLSAKYGRNRSGSE
jgi:hypothetical protein